MDTEPKEISPQLSDSMLDTYHANDDSGAESPEESYGYRWRGIWQHGVKDKGLIA